MIEPLQISLILPRSINALLILIVLLKLYKKYLHTIFRQRPLLNQLYIIGLLGWFGYLSLDIIIPIIAPISFISPFPDGKHVGYLSAYPSLLIANILRDIGLLGAIITSWSYLIAAFSIKYGELRTKKVFLDNKIVMFLIVIFSIITTFGDRVMVETYNNQVYTTATWEGIYGVFLVSVIILFFGSGILLFSILKSTVTTETDAKYRKKVKFLMYGVIAVIGGNTYWLFLSQLRKWFNPWIMENGLYGIFGFNWIGHFIWMLSPIFIFLGLKEDKIKTSNPLTPKKGDL